MEAARIALTSRFGTKCMDSLPVYLEKGGYKTARRVLLEMTPAAVIEEVKKAWLRGRGGAGFPAGVKWGFVPKSSGKPKYLCVNADEGEPGTFKDRYILGLAPHLVLEGVLIASYALGVGDAFIYIRGEDIRVAQCLENAVSDALAGGYLGDNIFGTGFSLKVQVFRGAGAYICGEETALLESIEGKQGRPRLKPPFPVSMGLFGCPTVINNVETLCNIPLILENGAELFLKNGKPRDGGTRLFGVSGRVRRPGVYELPVGTLLRDIIFENAGGLGDGLTLKAVIPGGMSSPILTPAEIDIPMDFDSLSRAGSMLGSAAIIVIDQETPIFDVLRHVARFYAHESCGKCTPCRIGTAWIRKIVERLAAGNGEGRDLDEITRLAENMKGKTLCPMGDAAALPIQALIRKFRAELDLSIGRIQGKGEAAC